MNITVRSLAIAVAGTACVVVVALLILFVVHFQRPLFTSDEAVLNLLAGAMVEQGRLLPSGWINNNGDLMMPSGALIVAPLLRWFANGFRVHSMAGLCAVLALPSALLFLLRTLRVRSEVALLAAALIASGLSYYATIFVYAQTTYVWWPTGFLLGASLILRHRQPRSVKKPRLNATLLFLLVFCISFANPGRVLLMMVMPLYALDWALRNGSTQSIAERRSWIRSIGLHDPLVVYSIIGGFVLAAMLYALLKCAGVTEAAYGAAGLRWGGWPSVAVHATTFARGWFSYFGGVGEWRDASVGAGFLTAFRYLLVVALSVIGLHELCRLPNQRNPARRALTMAFAAAFFPILLMYLLLEPLAFQKQEPTVRYFTVAFDILIVLAALRMQDLLRHSPRRLQVIVPALASVLVVIAAYRFIPVSKLGTPDFWTTPSSPTMRLGELLRTNDLHWGYATYWNAGATTVLSDSAVQVNAVEISARGVAPNAFMVLRDWYRPERWVGRTFLALAPDDVDARKAALIRAQFGDPVQVIKSADYDVLVYERNIAADLACPAGATANEPIRPGQPSARLIDAEYAGSSATTKQPNLARVHLRNEGSLPISGAGRFPLSVGVHLLDAAGAVVKLDWVHAPLRCPLYPGQEIAMIIALPPAEAGHWQLRFDLVQEGIAWFENRGLATIDLALDVAEQSPVAGSSFPAAEAEPKHHD